MVSVLQFTYIVCYNLLVYNIYCGINRKDYVVSVLKFAYMACYIYWFTYTELTNLDPFRMKPTGQDLLSVFMNSVASISLKKFSAMFNR